MLLEIKNILKTFHVKKGIFRSTGTLVRAVDGIDLTIAQGENTGLVGESGCGKTTLARLILKLYQPDNGSIMFEGQDIARLSSHQLRDFRKNVRMVFQDPFNSLDPRFTVRNIVAEAMTFEDLSSKEKDQRMRELLLAVKLPGEILERFPHEFSGGERQRIAIARALATRPKLLILDEAVSSLDVLVQEQILKLLNELKEKFTMTYLFVSHNLRVVKKISTKVAVMYNGKIVEMAKTEDVFQNPLHPYTKELLSSALKYRTTGRSERISFSSQNRMIDKGNGHYLLE